MLAPVRVPVPVPPSPFACAALSLSLSLSLAACSKQPAPSSNDASATRLELATTPAHEAASREPATASAPSAQVVAPSRPSSAPPPVAVPAHSCVVRSEQALGAAQRALSGFVGERARVVLVDAHGRALTAFESDGDEPFAQRARIELAAAVQRATLQCADRCELAFVDERGQLFATTLEDARFAPPVLLARGLDRRFAPALTQRAGRTFYAYTSSVDDAMHSFLVARVGDKVSAPHDLTPPGHGAAAPSFVHGSREPRLIVIDARAGLSPLLELELDPSGVPKPAEVRTPVSQPYAPPLLAAVRWPSGAIEVFYTLVGRLAMTAIARVPLRVAAEPTALSASRGYGELAFSVAATRDSALIAVEVPTATAPSAQRTLTLKLTDGASTYDALALAHEGEAKQPSLAVDAEGRYLLAYTSADRARVARLACAR